MLEASAETKLQLFELGPGKMLDLQINNPLPVRLKLSLVGYDIGRYIILKYPRVANNSEYNDVLIEGNGVIVRYLLEGDKGECFAFSSSIRSVTQHPERLLFIDYPKEIEKRQLRTQQRTSIHLPASMKLNDEIKNQGGAIYGVIVDISTDGCRFSFKTKNPRTTVKKCDVLVCIQSPVDGEIKIMAQICNSRNENGEISVGIKFMDDGNLVPKLLSQLFIV
ncbi:MAG: flagellar brake protein [Moritella sp.]|uniref:flagellar brake protein n=1 Tax=Moritella sp. TaxID=78556 RepID=UPI001D83C41A|nr:flagellar brake protein [Moritella sp.]NQZ49739.1 flagellar brake protein [Moritella sp.]